MRKIPTLFVRDAQGRSTREVNPGCEWVLAGEGRPTRKFDGTCCLIRNGVFYRRFRVQPHNATPAGWVHHTFDGKQTSGHGWLVVGIGAEDWMHRGAQLELARIGRWPLPDGTYELVGARIGKNPEGISGDKFYLWPHGSTIPDVSPRTFDTLRNFMEYFVAEGIVWWHEDGRMAKLTRADFGLRWPVLQALRAEL